MNLKPIASNMTELTVNLPNYRGDTKILFSYKTPVAAMNLSPEWHEEFGNGIVVTDCRWSATTSRHISKWTMTKNVATRPQSFFDSLV